MNHLKILFFVGSILISASALNQMQREHKLMLSENHQ